ncbi:hypothetical protein SARC_04210 [Sphaeroforma arctica JP610]|uniref:MrfA-like Zn-binding domain-containing protein n=1 Tax=Sphaeroforma arctica JP610 TaxID=667725 RepID=A0A0L0G329_9EUKA|nr:hypothetical protein SARC_04210 [Sphaeroforma arctica JP610]KNC83537.1 hypothetical protein SARC_04210 [Sphaeroforma arctica JP610]|eukprot:XP_014157439.1 hypothetical protein SARC_04210 [Sphaeroforma arctica JP610]
MDIEYPWVAYARKSDVNYHTAVNDQTLLVDYTVRRHLTGGPKAHPYTGAYGSVRVVTNVFGYKKILNKTRTIIESITSEIPDFEMITESLWIDIGLEFKNGLAEISLDYRGGLHACNHLLVNVLGFYLLCDRGDVQPVCYSEQETKNRPLCINIYDSVEGGTGISEAAYHKIEPIMQKAYELIKGCDCEEANGCPACTHDPSCGEYNNCLDKKAALWILERLVARTPTS